MTRQRRAGWVIAPSRYPDSYRESGAIGGLDDCEIFKTIDNYI